MRVKGRITIDKELCKGCGLCITVCPKKQIEISDSLNKKGYYPASFKDPLHAGTEFDLLEQRPGWFHITLSDDNEGWIPDNSAEII